jgi:hypothetical protein
MALSAGGAWAQSVNTERGPVSHPQAVADPVQGSEKGPVSHPQAAKDSPSTAQTSPQAPKDNTLMHKAGEGK